MKMQWKWSKDPKPDELKKLIPEIRTDGLRVLKEKSPLIAQYIVRRVRAGSIADDGQQRPIPEYSKKYQWFLGQLGESTKPDYTRTGTLLNSLRGRIRVLEEDAVELRIAPYGRVSTPTALADRKKKSTSRIEMGPDGLAARWWREPYTYTIKGGRTVSVKGMWIRFKGASKLLQDVSYKRQSPLYNAHLANLLSLRLGTGRWAKGGRPTPILSLTEKERTIVSRWLAMARQKVTGQVLKSVAGR